MSGQIVEITQIGHKLGKTRGFLEIYNRDKKLGQVSLDDILAVIISVPGCSISTALVDQLCQMHIPLVMCGNNFLPSSITLPVSGHGRQFQIMRSQMVLPEPRRKRAWQKIVSAKIMNQAEALLYFGNKNIRLISLAKQVKSGDPNNYEAQAARIYWQNMFGNDFRRDRDALGINSALNYSYAVLRACVARGLCAAGLHPSFSLHHKNPRNPINLVDDFIEPFRPISDMSVKAINSEEEISELTPQIKTKLASIINMLIPLEDEHSPLSLACVKVGRSFANYSMKETNELLLPKIPKILEVLNEKTSNSQSL